MKVEFNDKTKELDTKFDKHRSRDNKGFVSTASYKELKEEETNKEKTYLYWINYETRRPDPQALIVAHNAIEAIRLLAGALKSKTRILKINFVQRFPTENEKIIFYGNIMPALHIQEVSDLLCELRNFRNKFSGSRNRKTTKHQALYNLAKKKGWDDNPSIESGFEGDCLWLDENRQFWFLEAEGWDLEKDREELDEYWGSKGEKIYEQNGWFFYERKEK